MSPHPKSEFQHLLSDDDRLDEKDSVDIHDNPPLPDNVVKEEDNRVRPPLPPTCISKSFIKSFSAYITETDTKAQNLWNLIGLFYSSLGFWQL